MNIDATSEPRTPEAIPNCALPGSLVSIAPTATAARSKSTAAMSFVLCL
jgi:hypothetical protein